MTMSPFSHGHRADQYHPVELAYRSIKERIDHCKFRPGVRLQPAKLADDLGISKTPAREALVRLSAQRIIDEESRQGFRMVTPSEETLVSLHKAVDTLLRGAVKDWQKSGAITKIEERPKSKTAIREEVGAAESIATKTAQLFVNIARMSKNDVVVEVIKNLNDRIQMFRIIEYECIKNCREELKEIHELYGKGAHACLVRLLRRYHAKRVSVSGAVFNEALRRMYAQK